MKIEIEIRDNKFIYHYQVGGSDCHSKIELNADLLSLFSKCLEMCIHAYSTTQKTRRQEAEKKAIAIMEKMALKDDGTGETNGN